MAIDNDEYKICVVRGHEPAGEETIIEGDPPKRQDKCRYCTIKLAYVAPASGHWVEDEKPPF